MRYRQVHLDFHTSGEIPGIGAAFDKAQFQKALIEGHVDSITVFSKCHHGWAYHPSEANEIHPGLSFDLLGAQLEACREIGVNAPVYISAGFDEKEVLRHPEWLNVNPDGTETSTYTKAHYHLMCYNTPYLDKLCAQIEEVMQRYNPCGIFLDISSERRCVCASCVKSMADKGLDPENPQDVAKHGRIVYAEYCRRTNASVRKYSKTATIFHNAGHITHGRRDIADYDTHLELESLPTGGWGYDHFPMSAAYARTLGKEFLGMTGKFHTTWGEFGGFKHPNALRYEAALSLACGACVSVGDQLHPSGEMNLSTYRLIGKAYSEVEKKEPWCSGATNIADIAVYSCEAAIGERTKTGTDSNTGVNRMLLEGKQLFDFVDADADISGYKLVIFPDRVRFDEVLADKVNKYISEGGKVLLTGESGLKADEDAFAVETGASYTGKTSVRPDYLIPAFESVNGETAYVMYKQGHGISADAAEVFAYRQNSYFNRSWQHFSSHQHTPNDVNDAPVPAAVIAGNTAYIGWNIFEDYAEKGELICRETVMYAVNRLLGNDRTVLTSLPERGIVTVTKQGSRTNVHLLFAHTCKRGRDIEAIEDAVPLYDTKVSLKLESEPHSVTCVPEGQKLEFKYKDGRLYFTVPKFELHQIVSIE